MICFSGIIALRVILTKGGYERFSVRNYMIYLIGGCLDFLTYIGNTRIL